MNYKVGNPVISALLLDLMVKQESELVTMMIRSGIHRRLFGDVQSMCIGKWRM